MPGGTSDCNALAEMPTSDAAAPLLDAATQLSTGEPARLPRWSRAGSGDSVRCRAASPACPGSSAMLCREVAPARGGSCVPRGCPGMKADVPDPQTAATHSPSTGNPLTHRISQHLLIVANQDLVEMACVKTSGIVGEKIVRERLVNMRCPDRNPA